MQNCWDDEAFKEIVEKCAEIKDARIGLYLMKESGNIAEEKSARKINLDHVALAIKKVDDFQIKPKEGLGEDLKRVLRIVKEASGERIGNLYNTYSNEGGTVSYKSFKRRVNKLEEGRFISTEKVSGKDGNTTLVHHSSDKKLTEF